MDNERQFSEWTLTNKRLGHAEPMFYGECYTVTKHPGGDALIGCSCNGKCGQYQDELEQALELLNKLKKSADAYCCEDDCDPARKVFELKELLNSPMR